MGLNSLGKKSIKLKNEIILNLTRIEMVKNTTISRQRLLKLCTTFGILTKSGKFLGN